MKPQYRNDAHRLLSQPESWFKPKKRESVMRPCLERLSILAKALRSGKAVNCNTLAKRLEVSTRTIGRDVEFLRDRMRYEIEWNQAGLSFRLITAPEPVL